VRLALLLVVAACGGGSAKPAAPPTSTPVDPEPVSSGIADPDLAALIAEARSAAEAGDHARLRGLMADDFTFSFGDEASADAAVASWQQDPEAMPRLVQLIDRGCVLQGADQAICPEEAAGDGYLDYRVGFARAAGDWKMTFYVAGD
jgi:hypothetical protein